MDIRVEKQGQNLKTVHGITDCREAPFSRKKLYIDSVISDCRNFLKENPSETVIFCLKRDDGVNAFEVFDLFSKKYLEKGEIWYKENRIPTLGEVRGKIILMNRCGADPKNTCYTDFNTGLDFSDWCEQYSTDDIFIPHKIPAREKPSEEIFYLQDMYRLSPEKKWKNAVLPFLENPPQNKGIILNFLSANNGRFSPKFYIKHTNKNFEKFTFRKCKKYGWIICDYPTDEIINKIINLNF